MSEATDSEDEDLLPVDRRREERLAALPAVFKRNDERMALELVLLAPDQDPWSVIQGYGYTQAQALEVLSSPTFAALVANARRDVQENGVGFVAKARLQAEALLQDSFDMATDPTVSSAVRADLIKWTAAIAGWGPKKEAEGKQASGGFQINITFASPQVPQLVQGVTLEAEQ